MKLNELAMKSLSLDARAEKYGAEHAATWETSEHIGDIEEWKVRKSGDFLSIWDGPELIAFCSLRNHEIVDDAWVKPERRKQRVFSKLLWFLRSRENQKRLVLADLHSPATQEIIKGGLKQFKKSWWNRETGETAEFSIDRLEDFYKPPYIDWALVLENDDKCFDSWPRFNGGGFVKESYNWIDWTPE